MNFKNKRHLGYVSGWNRERKFGFVNSINDGESYFLHRSQIGEDICNGAVVEFEVWHDKEDETKTFAAKVLVVELPEVDVK